MVKVDRTGDGVPLRTGIDMIEGVLLILLGYGVWKYTRPKKGIPAQIRRRMEEVQRHVNEHDVMRKQELEKLGSLLTEYTRLKLALMEEIAQNRQVTQDAINQAERAKGALVSVMRTTGCPDREIEKVIAKVEGE